MPRRARSRWHNVTPGASRASVARFRTTPVVAQAQRSARDLPMACGPLFLEPRSIGQHDRFVSVR
jgi:hypothetical protein